MVFTQFNAINQFHGIYLFIKHKNSEDQRGSSLIHNEEIVAPNRRSKKYYMSFWLELIKE